MLPELKSGDLIQSPAGIRARVRKLSKRAAAACSAFDEPLYRLIYPNACNTGYEVTSPRIWTYEELSAARVTIHMRKGRERS
jgi:hypothetical protein